LNFIHDVNVFGAVFQFIKELNNNISNGRDVINKEIEVEEVGEDFSMFLPVRSFTCENSQATDESEGLDEVAVFGINLLISKEFFKDFRTIQSDHDIVTKVDGSQREIRLGSGHNFRVIEGVTIISKISFDSGHMSKRREIIGMHALTFVITKKSARLEIKLIGQEEDQRSKYGQEIA